MGRPSVTKVQGYLEGAAFNKLYYGGKFVAPKAGETLETLYPATGEVVHAVPRGRAADVTAAVEAATAGQLRQRSLCASTNLPQHKKVTVRRESWINVSAVS